MAVLRVENLTVDYPLDDRVYRALDGISFALKKGEVLGVIGESGSGKSSMAAAIIRLLCEPGKVSSGSIYLDTTDLISLEEKEMINIRGGRIGSVFQDPTASLNPLLTIGQQLTETLTRHLSLTPTQAQQHAIKLLKQVGINNPKDRLKQYPHQFSGGMQQRVVMAIALCCDPDVIVADEPTSALDVSLQQQILLLMRNMCKKSAVAILLISHDMGVISRIAERVIVMYKGKVVEVGHVKTILTAPKHPYTQSLIASVPPSSRKIERFHTMQYGKKTTPDSAVAKHWQVERLPTTPVDTMKNIVEVNAVSVRFALNKTFFTRNRRYFYANKKINLAIKCSEIFGLVGESGSGKSTLARAIAQLVSIDSGSILYDGVDIGLYKGKKFQQNIQMIFQDPYLSLNPRLSIFDTIAEPMRFYGLATKRNIEHRVPELLGYVGLEKAAVSKYPHQFSGGQRQRISIARSLATRPRILICDEPTSSLDVSVQASILNMLKDLQKKLGLTLLFITHDLPVVRQMCDRIAVLRGGEVIEVGDTEEVFNAPRNPYVKSLLDLMPKFDTFTPIGSICHREGDDCVRVYN